MTVHFQLDEEWFVKEAYIAYKGRDVQIQDRFLGEQLPDFYALSYCWGDRNAGTVSVDVNGSSHDITINLFRALDRIQD